MFRGRRFYRAISGYVCSYERGKGVMVLLANTLARDKLSATSSTRMPRLLFNSLVKLLPGTAMSVKRIQVCNEIQDTACSLSAKKNDCMSANIFTPIYTSPC
jgi:hypothetical protein